MRTVENAPCRRGRTSVAASSMRSASWEASSAAMISESDVERKRDALLAQLGVQLDGVDEVAVVAERQLAAVGAVHGLGVVPAVGARRRVAHVADGDVAAQRAQLLLVEDLVDEPELAQGHDVPVHVGGGDAGRFLTTVLEGVEREVGQSRDVVAGGVDPEHSALVAWSLALVEVRHDVKNTQPLGVLTGADEFPRSARSLLCQEAKGAVLPPRPDFRARHRRHDPRDDHARRRAGRVRAPAGARRRVRRRRRRLRRRRDLEADLVAVEALARLRLTARRLGCGLRLRGAVARARAAARLLRAVRRAAARGGT